MYTLLSIPNTSQNKVTKSHDAVWLLPLARTMPSKESKDPARSAPASDIDQQKKFLSRTDAKETCSLRKSHRPPACGRLACWTISAGLGGRRPCGPSCEHVPHGCGSARPRATRSARFHRQLACTNPLCPQGTDTGASPSFCGAIPKLSPQYEQQPAPPTLFRPVPWSGPAFGLQLPVSRSRSIVRKRSRAAATLACKTALSLPEYRVGMVTSTISRMRGQNTSLLESCMVGFGHDTILELLDAMGEVRWFSAKVSAHGICTKHEQGAVMSGR